MPAQMSSGEACGAAPQARNMRGIQATRQGRPVAASASGMAASGTGPGAPPEAGSTAGPDAAAAGACGGCATGPR